MDYASSLLGLLPGGRRTPGLKELLSSVETYLPQEQVERIREAAEFGASAHKGQKRLSGEPYIAHPVAAAAILADLHLDADTIVAAILHDVIEDTPTPKDQLASRFGAHVAELVDGVTKLDQIKFKSREEAQAESFRKMLLAMVRDLRVILVKLADRTHNMRTIEAMSAPRRRAIARETLEIYAPIAERLGLYNMKLELEDLGFKALYPRRYQVLEYALKKARGNQKEFLKKIEQQLRAALLKNDIQARVETREKHLHSIYSKMRRKRAMLNEIVDVYGLRIVVDRADTCYRALGVVHSVFKPMPGRFKDYIAIPRVNGYQSLHTTLFGPNGVPIEAQIRTEDMHRVAESGIAAHWRYKVGEAAGSMQQERTREWLSNLVELQEDGNSEEFLESVKVDLFPDKVYVFTPKGEILRLPSGATVVDFAYAVHTDIGNRCVAAKVDRRLTPLRTVLRNGQTVEIITAKGAMPNPSWVNFVVTAKARSAIRHYLKSLRRTEAIALGQRLVNQALGEFRLSLDDVTAESQAAALGELGMKDLDELYENIGLGNRLAPLVARRLLPGAQSEGGSGALAPLAIAGTEGLLVSYARCCFPIPGDPIFAFLSAGRGVVIHRENCVNVEDYRKHPEKWLPVAWQVSADRLFSSEIRIDVLNRTGMLAQVAAAIANLETNIDRVAIDEHGSDSVVLTFELRVHDRKHLARIVRVIRRMPDVVRVTRSLAAHARDAVAADAPDETDQEDTEK
ncbi:MAG: bifunctional (p)ppGpp synthetase/guanosine-3',5'-bis(diphosphate) 3'-pyrophosphohydrolase [Sinobacteraceae bacterium]|nr:bifunctional (p)ppGpp synthetase/guanosine-3',5'-bis(diphosphate) 3'-pyrophosphohydrolase [Nevskiaceae bacterium]MBV8853723.1 bifunctional (p)ppGpp synthetase/guanosine-3',5'-bis(diphosphate) 3'-pyrophosphohydrolase [Nevskiaceae bacterium]MBV9913040.1 bifunctional (p)ppGpp synthetase/guanosine-3',5'-bis(diphosphate) 3'-pyrophosphohydrolase [Nevskiaceae bacterium]